jgi:hypothetical protein
MDVIGIHEAADKTCPFSMNERDPRSCTTKECMAWTPWIGDKTAGVCALIPDTAFNAKIVRGKEG